MNRAENIRRAYSFQRPACIPLRVGVSSACWHHYDVDALDSLFAEHPIIFPDYQKGKVDPEKVQYAPWETAGAPWTDPWGCTWESSENGITGAVVKHPLDSWDKLATFKAPDPEKYNGLRNVDWDAFRESCKKAKETGSWRQGRLEHGYFLLRLTYLRGFENVMYDMMDEDPHLLELIDIVEQYTAALVEKNLSCGLHCLYMPEDLGSQTGPLISPSLFRKYIKPTYRRLMKRVRDEDVFVFMHSDGCIMDLMDDLIQCGVSVINLQDLVNGIDNIARELKGEIVIDLDIDRQKITRFGSPKDIDDHIKEAVMKLGSPEGGLSMVYGLYPGTPLENVRAVLDAMEKYCTYYQ